MSDQGHPESKTILVVEDDEPIRVLLCELLRDDGYRVITAVNGVEGVQHTFAETPDVVLTDVMMPAMDGLTFIRRVRSQVPVSSLPIIVVSALAGEDKVVEAFEAGATDYLVKPFRPFELLARIRVALKQRLEPMHIEVAERGGMGRRKAKPVREGMILDMGKYAILSEIGEGGMGRVFHARHMGFGTEAAVKVLDPELAGDRKNVLRFLREVRIAAQLDHPHIVKVFDIGLTDQVYYYAMEKLPGHSLSEEVWELGGMPEETILNIGAQIASALAYMHDLGFLHRDVKPDNILFATEGGVKLIDFGLARAIDDGRLTREGSFVGTPGFVAPENIAKYREPEPIADIYALGSTLYTAAVGKTAFERQEEPTEKLRAQLVETPPPPHTRNPAISEACSQVIARMMSKNPEDRYRDMNEVRTEIGRLRRGGKEANR